MTNKKHLKQADEQYLKGNAYNDRGDYGLAEESFLKALYLYTKIQEWEKVVACEISIGNVCCNKSRFEDAIEHWMNALKIYEQSNLYSEAGELCVTVGDLYYDQKNLWGSGHYYEKAKLLFQKDLSKNELNYGVSCQKLGNVYFQIGQNEQAEISYNNALPIFKKYGSMLSSVADIYQAIGHIHLTKGSSEVEYAKANFMASLEIYEQLKIEEKIQEVTSILHNIETQEKQRKLEKKVKQLEKMVKPNHTSKSSKDSLAYTDTDFSDFEAENVKPQNSQSLYQQAKFIPTNSTFVATKSKTGTKSPEMKKHITHMLNNMTTQMQYDEIAKANKMKF